MSARTLAEIDADIDRCNWLRHHLHDLGDAANQDRVLAQLTAERDALTAQAVAA
jgi:hypothetical protein